MVIWLLLLNFLSFSVTGWNFIWFFFAFAIGRNNKKSVVLFFFFFVSYLSCEVEANWQSLFMTSLFVLASAPDCSSPLCTFYIDIQTSEGRGQGVFDEVPSVVERESRQSIYRAGRLRDWLHLPCILYCTREAHHQMGSNNMLAKVIIRIVLAPFLKSNDSLWRTGQHRVHGDSQNETSPLRQLLSCSSSSFFFRGSVTFSETSCVFHVWCCHHAITFSIDDDALRSGCASLPTSAVDFGWWPMLFLFMCDDGDAHKVPKKNTRNMFVCVCAVHL